MIPRKPLLRSAYSIKRTPLRRVSKKRAVGLRIYSKLRKQFLEEHPYCQAYATIWYPACDSPPSVEIHHKRGRGKYLNETSTWLAVCRMSHDFIHQHPKAARIMGFLQ